MILMPPKVENHWPGGQEHKSGQILHRTFSPEWGLCLENHYKYNLAIIIGT